MEKISRHLLRPSVPRTLAAFGSVRFLAKEAQLPVRGASILAVEPVAAVDARVEAYRRRLLFAAESS
jgi:hypothetical protein